ncbi:MAG: NCS2 family permease [Burkholderiales bacterium]|nr:NCS2 family permease [Burkholderiales bacterium]
MLDYFVNKRIVKNYSCSQEVIGGLINFMAIAYIVIVNPLILNADGHGFPIEPVVTSTVVLIVIMTIIAGLIVKLPFVIAPGMGINAIVAYTLIIHDKLPINIALGVILISSVLLLITSVTKIRQIIVHAIPETIQISLSIGIGLFLFLIGAKNVGLVVANTGTIIGMGHVSTQLILCFIGFILAVVLFIKRKPYAFLLPIFIVTVVNMLLNPQSVPTRYITMPDFSLFLQVDILGALKFSLLPVIIALFITNFFDATSTTLGLLSQVNFDTPDDKSTCLKKALVVDSVAGVASGLIGVSPGVVFVESSAAIQHGAKTGIASLVTALLCIPLIFLSPLVEVIPSSATSPILMLVGILMFSHIKRIDIGDFENLVAATLTIVMMPLCFSITAGAVYGILSYTILKILLGKTKEISPALIIIAIFCSSWFFVS